MVHLLEGEAAQRRLREAASGDIFTSPDWTSVIQDAYAIPVQAVCDQKTGATLPFGLVDDLAGKRLIVFPFSDYVVLPSNPELIVELAEHALDCYPDFSISIKIAGELAQWPKPSGWTITQPAIYHRIEAASEQVLWGNLSATFRNNITNGKKSGVTTRIDSSDAALDRFYALHASLRNRKFSAIPQPRVFLKLIQDRFFSDGRGFVLEACHNDQVVSSCLVLLSHSIIYYKLSSSSPDALPISANKVMLWELLRIASERHLMLDLGRTGLGESYKGLRRFKEALGGVPYPILTLTHGPKAPDPRATARSAEFMKLVGKLSQLLAASSIDESINDAAATLLYRYFA